MTLYLEIFFFYNVTQLSLLGIITRNMQKYKHYYVFLIQVFIATTTNFCYIQVLTVILLTFKVSTATAATTFTFF